MITVALFIRTLKKGGAEKQSLILTEYLSQFYQTCLIVFKKDDFVNHIIPVNLDIHYLNGNLFKKCIQLYKILKNNKITFLFNYLPINNVLGIVVGKLAGVKYLFGGIRGVKMKSRFKMVLTKFICNNMSTSFISNSHEAASNYASYGFKKNKILVIHNAIVKVNVKKIPQAKSTIISIGRFTVEKDFFTAIKAFDYLISSLNVSKEDVIYKIIGYGKLEESIRGFIKSHNLDDIIILQTDGEVGDQYSRSDILLNTSLYEGMPNVVMEAMSHKLPVVATKAGDTEYLVQDGLNGFLCPVKDYKYIAHKLQELILNKSLQHSMGKRSLEIIEKGFYPEKVFTSYMELIENTDEY
jgi:glycosyltransferase involved in cell wall biosynthesis